MNNLSSQSSGESKKIFTPPTKEHKQLFAYFCFCALIFVNFLPASWSNDAVTVLGIASGEIESEGSGSYYLTALIFGALGESSIVLILLIGYFWTAELSRYCVNRLATFALLFCVTPGILMGMIRPQKDVFVGVLVFVVLYAYRRYGNDWRRLIFCLGLCYFAYGLVMRPYYILIFSLFLLTYFVRKYFKIWNLSLLVLLFLCSLLLSQEQMILLQGARDGVNFLRGVDEEQRTAFGNFYPYIDSTFEFWVNYFYAFFYLNFPLWNYFDVPAIALQFSVFLYIYLTLKSVSGERGSGADCLGMLFYSSFIFFPLFEPDLGSYARHVSLASAYLAPVISVSFSGRRA